MVKHGKLVKHGKIGTESLPRPVTNHSEQACCLHVPYEHGPPANYLSTTSRQNYQKRGAEYNEVATQLNEIETRLPRERSTDSSQYLSISASSALSTAIGVLANPLQASSAFSEQALGKALHGSSWVARHLRSQDSLLQLANWLTRRRRESIHRRFHLLDINLS